MKIQKNFELDEVKKKCKSDNDDNGYVFEILIKSCVAVLLIIGIVCLIAYGVVGTRNTLNELRIMSKTSVAETSDTAEKNNSPVNFWEWYEPIFFGG